MGGSLLSTGNQTGELEGGWSTDVFRTQHGGGSHRFTVLWLSAQDLYKTEPQTFHYGHTETTLSFHFHRDSYLLGSGWRGSRSCAGESSAPFGYDFNDFLASTISCSWVCLYVPAKLHAGGS